LLSSFPPVLCDRLLISLSFLTDTATTGIYTLSLHDALPISERQHRPLIRINTRDAHLTPSTHHVSLQMSAREALNAIHLALVEQDRKSTRLNSSHVKISYAVFCLKKKKNENTHLVQAQASQP